MNSSRIIRLPLFILSFVLALTLYLFVQIQSTVPVPKTGSFVVKPQVNGLPSNLYVGGIPEVRITVEGDTTAVQKAVDGQDQISASIDLSKAVPGHGTFPVRLMRGTDGNLTVSLLDRFVTLNVEPIETVSVPITVETISKLSNPTLLYEGSTLSAKTVEITGPESALKGAVAVTTLDLSQIDKGKIVQAPIEIQDSKGGSLNYLVTPRLAQVTIRPILVAAPLTKNIYVNVNFTGQVAAGFHMASYSLSKQTISVTGASARLAAISAVSVNVNVSGLNHTAEFDVRPNLPLGIQVAKNQVLRLRVEVVPDPTPPPTTTSAPGTTTPP